ncbi:hypothetical protein [Bosea sp. PAMC 26642]|uniref:hypothetical protein n=1 Tax=Bosea sp. (strain PAMC 26642) TaxID=1792307 RepID=UPI000ABF66FB|nr:hypothetical protein [Bosea sp. PAMC 26642]
MNAKTTMQSDIKAALTKLADPKRVESRGADDNIALDLIPARALYGAECNHAELTQS